MPNGQPSTARLCGQLFAALAALHRLGHRGKGDHPFGEAGMRHQASAEPRKYIQRHLPKTVEYFLAARGLGNGEAAAKIFRSLPDLLPGSDIPQNLGHPESEEFCEGFTQQTSAYAKDYRALA